MNRYDDRARLVFHYAREEGNTLGYAMVEPEHLLLGLMREAGTAAQILQEFGASLEGMRGQLEAIVGRRGEGSPLGNAPGITPKARRVMELSAAEARNLGLDATSTEHILLGILREGEGVAYRILQELTGDTDALRGHILAHSSHKQASDLREQGSKVRYEPIPNPDLETRVEQLETVQAGLVRVWAQAQGKTDGEQYGAATRDEAQPSSQTALPDSPLSSAVPSTPPRQNRALEYRKNWLTRAPIGLTLFGLGLSITLEADRRKNAREPYFWLGTLGLVVLNAGLAFLGDAVKSRVLLELESR